MKHLLALSLLCAAPFLVQAADYKTDADHTFVYFDALHNGTSTVRGRFDTVEGHIVFNREARTGQADIRIDIRSISTGSKGFDEHLLGGRISSWPASTPGPASNPPPSASRATWCRPWRAS